MRAVLSLLVLVSCTVPAFAADVPPVESQAPVPPTVALPGHGSALLQLSPMYVEISDSLAGHSASSSGTTLRGTNPSR